MATIEMNIQQFFNHIQQEPVPKVQKIRFEKESCFILDLFFVHVFLETFFFSHEFEWVAHTSDNDFRRISWTLPRKNAQHKKMIRCQGVHAFQNKKHIPVFLKQEYLKRQGYIHLMDKAECEETFEMLTHPTVYSQTVESDLYDTIPQIQDLKETLSFINTEKQKALTRWVPVVSKAKVKSLKRKLNNSFVLNSWDACHTEFIRTMTHSENYDYFFDYCGIKPDTSTNVPSLNQIIELLFSVPIKQLETSIKFLDHIGEFNPTKLFGMTTLELTRDDINQAFPHRSHNLFRQDDIDGNDFECKCRSDKKCQKSSHSHSFVKDLITSRNIHLNLF